MMENSLDGKKNGQIKGLKIETADSQIHNTTSGTQGLYLISNFFLCFSFAPELVGYSAPRDLHRRAAYSICESLFLIHQDVYHDLFVLFLMIH